MIRRRLLPTGAALFLVLAASAGAEPREIRLDNGLRVLLDPDRAAVGVDVGVWYDTGPADEPAGRSGLTPLLERLMFRGSPRYAPGEYARRMAEHGATFNTFLAPDFCEFYSTGPSEALGALLDLEADRMAGQRITAANVAAETRALAEEQQRLEANPVTRALQQLYATAYGAHPYARPLQGRAADRARLTPAACAEFAKARLGPGNALVTVVGNFDPDSAEARVRHAFGALPRHGQSAGAPPVPPAASRRGTLRSPIRMVLVGWRAPADSACGAELAVLAQILGAGRAPRLGTVLVQQKRLAANANCGFDGRRRASLFSATAWAAPGADSAALEQALIDEVEKVAREGVTDAEVARARKALLLATRIDRQGVRGRAQSLGVAAMTDGDWRQATGRVARMESLTPADVQRVAKQVLAAEHRSVVWTIVPPAAPAARPASAAAKKGGRS